LSAEPTADGDRSFFRGEDNWGVAGQGRLSDVDISAREAEVLAALGERLSNAEIGARLFISVRTVESHVSSLLRKLQVADRRALAAVAGICVRLRWAHLTGRSPLRLCRRRR